MIKKRHVKPYQADLDIPHGLAIDILPLDYYPKSESARKKQVRWALIYSLFRAQTIPEKTWWIDEMGKLILIRISPNAFITL